MPKIAIAILTRNRPKEFEQTFEHWNKYKPDNAEIFVVDDCSDKVYCNADYRFPERAGIAKAKNKCLELMYLSGADYFFLSEDDCFPISDKAIESYVNSKINHLCFTFTDAYDFVPRRKNPFTYGNFHSHRLPNGCMMFFTRKCIEMSGGFDERFGMCGYEHVDLTRRIYNLKLIPYKNMDIIGSDKLFCSLDKELKVKRSFSKEEKQYHINKGSRLFRQKAKDVNFVPFKSISSHELRQNIKKCDKWGE